MKFAGKARRLESLDISRLAYTIGCGEDHLHAVMEVETLGGGFDTHGRVKILFEPHVFYRELSGPKRQEAIAAGLAYRRWGESRYPKDSYPRLMKAMVIDAEAALRSCSWGLGQIMGFNHLLAGYASVQAMVEAFCDDEASHLAAMVEFIVSNGLDDDLRREDWRGFARGYNGSGYAEHGYHTKLKRAFDKWKRIPDTAFTPDDIDRSPVNPNPPEDTTVSSRGMPLSYGMRGPDVANLQGILAGLGFHNGKQDGIFLDYTKASVAAFQSAHDLVPDGMVGDLTWAALATAQPKPLRNVSVEDLRDSGSETIEQADALDKGSRRTGLTLTGGGLLDVGVDSVEKLTAAESSLEAAQRIIVDNWLVLLVVVFGVGLYFYGPAVAEKMRRRRVRDAQTGAHLGR